LKPGNAGISVGIALFVAARNGGNLACRGDFPDTEIGSVRDKEVPLHINSYAYWKIE
jgi:hypothetical protein